MCHAVFFGARSDLVICVLVQQYNSFVGNASSSCGFQQTFADLCRNTRKLSVPFTLQSLHPPQSDQSDVYVCIITDKIWKNKTDMIISTNI